MNPKSAIKALVPRSFCVLGCGVREPTIAWCRIGSNPVACGAISGTTDILLTFVSLTGGEIRDEVKIDGCDISPLLLGESRGSPHEAWFYYHGTGVKKASGKPID